MTSLLAHICTALLAVPPPTSGKMKYPRYAAAATLVSVSRRDRVVLCAASMPASSDAGTFTRYSLVFAPAMLSADEAAAAASGRSADPARPELDTARADDRMAARTSRRACRANARHISTREGRACPSDAEPPSSTGRID